MRHAIMNTKIMPICHIWLPRILAIFALSGTSVSPIYALDTVTKPLGGSVTFNDKKLTALLTSTPLQQVMEEMSKVTGVQIRWLDGNGEEPITVEVVALPLSQAIPRLLRNRNFLLFYSSTRAGAQLTQVWISSKKKETGQPAHHSHSHSHAQTLSSPGTADPTEEEFISPDVLLQTALYDRGLAARLDAITRLEEYAAQDPRVTAAFSHLAHHDTNPEVQQAAVIALQRLEEE